MKKLKLKKWVKVVLLLALLVDLFIIILECDSCLLLLVKTIMCSIIGLIILIPLKEYGDM